MMAIVEQLLQGLRIPYTKEYLKNKVDIHPFKHSLYALSTVLSTYGIETDSARLSQKEDKTTAHRALDCKPSLIRRMREFNRKMIDSQFTSSKMAEGYADVLRKMVI